MILQTNPKAGYLAHKAEIDAAIHQVLDSGRYILGSQVADFEDEFAQWMGAAHAIGVANGTDALELSLRALDITPGQIVFTVAHTAVATVAAIERCNAIPVLVDVDPATYTMDPGHLADAIRSCQDARPACIIPVHLYGQPADMPEIMTIAMRYGLKVVEDCAQAHGAQLHGRTVGTWGDLGAFSFYPTKNLAALGDGGAVLTDDPQLAGKVRALREYGWNERRESTMPGINSRLDEVQGALLRVKLRYLEEDNARRREIANLYNTRLAETTLKLPDVRTAAVHVFHQFVIRSQYRDELQAYLKENGVNTLVHYPVPIHLQPTYKRRIRLGCSGLVNTEKLCGEILSLPMYPQLRDEEATIVSELIAGWHAR